MGICEVCYDTSKILVLVVYCLLGLCSVACTFAVPKILDRTGRVKRVIGEVANWSVAVRFLRSRMSIRGSVSLLEPGPAIPTHALWACIDALTYQSKHPD